MTAPKSDFAAAVPLLRALALCHQELAALAADLRTRPLVPGVLHQTDLVPQGDCFRLIERVTPERLDGRWTYWRLEVTVTPRGQVTVEADALLRVDADDKPVIDVIAAGVILPAADAPKRLVEIAKRLCATKA